MTGGGAYAPTVEALRTPGGHRSRGRRGEDNRTEAIQALAYLSSDHILGEV
jgi:hypothetical protein